MVAVSTGETARAVGHAAAPPGVPAVVCMARMVPANKVRAVRATGAEVRIEGQNQDEAEEAAEALASRAWPDLRLAVRRPLT